MPIELNINNQYQKLQFTQYPGGERGVLLVDSTISNLSNFSNLSNIAYDECLVVCKYKHTNDLLDTLLVYNALQHMGYKRIHLLIPYLPAAREDRVEECRSFGLQVTASILNTCEWETITCHDVHSNVAAALFKHGVFKNISQSDILSSLIDAYDKYKLSELNNPCLLAPDVGAIKKAEKLSEKLNIPLFSATKSRNIVTGQLSKTTVPQDVIQFKNIIIVDDICDGGRTFLNLAEEIKKVNPECNLHLLVTHGIFSAGREKLELAFKTVIAFHNIDRW